MDQVQPNAGQPVTPQPTIIVNQAVPEAPKTNGMGVAGFVLALLGLFLGWVPTRLDSVGFRFDIFSDWCIPYTQRPCYCRFDHHFHWFDCSYYPWCSICYGISPIIKLQIP